MKHKLTDYQILRHGVESSDYFQGCGTSHTQFDHVQTGIGDTEEEAFNDAIESIAMSESFAEGEIERLEKEHGENWDGRNVQAVCGLSDEEVEGNDSLPYWRVSIRYNVESLEPASL